MVHRGTDLLYFKYKIWTEMFSLPIYNSLKSVVGDICLCIIESITSLAQICLSWLALQEVTHFTIAGDTVLEFIDNNS